LGLCVVGLGLPCGAGCVLVTCAAMYGHRCPYVERGVATLYKLDGVPG